MTIFHESFEVKEELEFKYCYFGDLKEDEPLSSIKGKIYV